VRVRVWSSVGVVIAGLLPILCGGPVFALFFVLLCGAGFREYLGLAGILHSAGASLSRAWGYLAIVILALASLLRPEPVALFGAIAVALFVPMIAAIFATGSPGAFAGWALTSSGALYLGLPLYAGIALRDWPGQIDARWLTDIATTFAFAWPASPRGLAWVLFVVLATWVGDSFAYLGGRSFGRHKLAPRISPNKTVEGAITGFAGSILVGIVWFAVAGLGSLVTGAIVGAVIAVSGQVGDLAESMLKRQAGVKDSGALIPGHGGILDRIDALLFAIPASYLAAASVERLAG
jgi:phosphatidate cytidylyltransferase